MSSNVTPVRSTRKARAILDKMLETRAITPGGYNWLVAATDPFHDTEVRCTGYPDISVTRSLCQTVTRTFNVTTPTPDEDTNWDCHIFFNPTTISWQSTNALAPNSPGFLQYSMDLNGGLSIVPTAAHIYGGVNVLTMSPGDAWWDPIIPAISYDNVAFSYPFSNDVYRLIGAGFEVVNTTAQLYKGGTVTAYRTPSQKQAGTIWVDSGNGADSAPVTWCAFPPLSQDEAVLYPDSKTWAAEDGIYSICTLNKTQNDYVTTAPSTAGMLLAPSTQVLNSGIGGVPVYLPFSSVLPLPVNPIQRSATNTLPWDVNGCYFTGLNSHTALQVTSRYYFERVPSVSNQEMIVLTKQPCSYDPLALEIYSRVLAKLPVGVCVGENPLGEWFASVLQEIGNWAPTIGSALGTVIPGAGLVGAALGAGAKGIREIIVSNQPAPVNRPRPRRKQTVALPPRELARGRAQFRGPPQQQLSRRQVMIKNLPPRGSAARERIRRQLQAEQDRRKRLEYNRNGYFGSMNMDIN